LTNISHLTINKNIAKEGIENLTNITRLDLGFEVSVSYKIQFLTNLTSLNLNKNLSITEKELCPLTNLTRLDLGKNRNLHLTDLVSSLRKLTYLDCHDVEVQYINIAKINAHPALTTLDLNPKEITWRDVSQLTNLANLDALRNKFSSSLRRRFCLNESLKSKDSFEIMELSSDCIRSFSQFCKDFPDQVTNKDRQNFKLLMETLNKEAEALYPQPVYSNTLNFQAPQNSLNQQLGYRNLLNQNLSSLGNIKR
jgi:hypothetical protein